MITTMVISYLITGKVDMALKIGAIEVVAKMTLQYWHERIWAHIRFGVSKQALDYHK